MQNEKLCIFYVHMCTYVHSSICAVEGMAGWEDACIGWKEILKLTLKKKDSNNLGNTKVTGHGCMMRQQGLVTEESVFVDAEIGFGLLNSWTLHGFVFIFSFHANCGTYRIILTYNIRIFICLNYKAPYANASVLHCVTFIICTMVGPQVSTSDQGSNLLGNAQT